MQEWNDMLEKDDKVWDQNAFNDLMRRGAKPDPARADRLFWCAIPLFGEGEWIHSSYTNAVGCCAGLCSIVWSMDSLKHA